jgi:hypothetical protein
MSRHTYPSRGSLHPATAVPTISRYDNALNLHISDCFFTSSAAPHLGAASASLICTTICIDFTFSEQRRIHEAKKELGLGLGLPLYFIKRIHSSVWHKRFLPRHLRH